mmetsp:Transcript_34218/g.59868  ORF Transcript_34218/g.59868 Transcript_34218/m.59868 type:complete len:290 (+) Transcript_34218:2120-2989(+)
MQSSDENFLNDSSNLSCFDCEVPRPRVANLKLAIMVCDQCAKRHPEQENVKLVGDPNWSEAWSLIMSRGGNERYRDFLDDNNLALNFEIKYLSNAAHYYSCKIAEVQPPDFQVEELSLAYVPKAEGGWFSAIYGTAGSVLSYTSGIGSKLVSAVSSTISTDHGILNSVAEKGAGVISTVAGAAGSVAGAASSAAYYALGYATGREEESKKAEFIKLVPMNSQGQPIPEQPGLSISQAIIDSADIAPPQDGFENISSVDEVEPSAPSMTFSYSSSGEYKHSAELYPSLTE